MKRWAFGKGPILDLKTKHAFFVLPSKDVYFLALNKTKTATPAIIPPKISKTCNGKPPVEVATPSGPFSLTIANSLPPLL